MNLKVIQKEFSVCKLDKTDNINLTAEFTFVGVTDEEISLVCPTDAVPEHTIKRDDGWKAFRIEGELDFSLIGILSKISAVLAENKIGIFAVSTFNTDYILTKAENFQRALDVLKQEKYIVLD